MGKRKNRKRDVRWAVITLTIMALLALAGMDGLMPRLRVRILTLAEKPAWIQEEIIDVDGDSRSGDKLEGIRDVVIHYVGNPGTSAMQNRNWYANPESEVSSHFLVGLEGEVIQCLPLDEKSAASNHRNRDTISIEVCHPDESGKFSEETYEALVELTAWLLRSAWLGPENIIRHYDVTGKNCPKYFVENEYSWQQFRVDVAAAMEGVKE